MWHYDDQPATTAHWIVSKAWDFFKNAYNRNGPNAGGGHVRVFADGTSSASSEYHNGNPSNPFKIMFGKRNGIDRANLDIAGHEFTHGVLVEMAGPTAQGESGSLNESFCDIFGFMVERTTQPNNWDWTLGEDSYLTRDIQNPGNSPQQNLGGCTTTWPTQPTEYLGANWYTGTCDEYGRHVNDGVQNRWFYLLSQGGSQNGITVQGIGPDKAALIAYYNMNNNLYTHANYSAAKNGSIAAAVNLYGFCSNEAVQTQNAWAAVKVGAPAYPTINGPTTVYVNGSNNVVFPSMPITFTANLGGAGGAMPFIWTVPSGWTYTTSGVFNNTLTITNFNGQFGGSGTQSISVRQMSCITTTFGVEFIHLVGGNGGSGTLEPGRVRLWPNPVRGNDLFFDVEFENETEPLAWTISVYDANGAPRFTNSYSGDLPRSIDILTLQPGNYLFYVQRGDVMQATEFVRQQ